jgi:hypothetical protein
VLETGRKFGGKLSVGPTSKTAHTYDGRNGQAYSMARAIRCMRERYFHRFMEGQNPDSVRGRRAHIQAIPILALRRRNSARCVLYGDFGPWSFRYRKLAGGSYVVKLTHDYRDGAVRVCGRVF